MRVVINPTKVTKMPKAYPALLRLLKGPGHADLLDHLYLWWRIHRQHWLRLPIHALHCLNLLGWLHLDNDWLFDHSLVELYR